MPSERDIGFEIRTLSNLIRRDVEKNIAAMDPKPNGDEELEAFFRITEKLKKNMENAE